METQNFYLTKSAKKMITALCQLGQVKKKPDGSPEMHHSPDDLII